MALPPRSNTSPCRTVDANGNLIQKTENGSVWTYEWNAENQLTRVTKDSVEVATFSYDPLGRRVERVAGGVTTAYAYDGVDILRETRTGGTVFTHVHGPGIDEPLAREDQAAALTYYHADGLGSVLKRTSQAGTVAHEYRYDAWGSIAAGAAESGYAYTGREWDPEAGLYYYRARFYDPSSGAFINEDPLGGSAGINFYAYAEGNPATLADPLGLAVMPTRHGRPIPLWPETPIPGASVWAKLWYYFQCIMAVQVPSEAASTFQVPKFSRSLYGRLPGSGRSAVLQRNPVCVYCGSSAANSVDHIRPYKLDFVQGGWADDFVTRTSRANDPLNLTGACIPCNSQKGSRRLGTGPGEYWPPLWPWETWWPFGGP